MPLADESTYTNALQSVAKIVSVYLEQSAELKPNELVSLVEDVLNVLHQRTPASGNSTTTITDQAPSTAATNTEVPPATPSVPLTPAVPVDQSITPDYLVCLEDGNKVKLLKRYLRSKYDLTPRQYREKWGLPKDYPMVAPSYSAKRTEIARASGLGARRPESVENTSAAAPAPIKADPASSDTAAAPKSASKRQSAASKTASEAAAKPASAAKKTPKPTAPVAESKPTTRSKRNK